MGHGFPFTSDHLVLASGGGASGDAAVAYKSEVVLRLADEGWAPTWGYGNAESGIQAFLLGGVPREQVFLVGELSGAADSLGVQPLPDDQAYSAHLAEWMPMVPSLLKDQPVPEAAASSFHATDRSE